MSKITLDLIVDLAQGDSGKGILSNHFSKLDYTHTLKVGGGSNCGHSFYHNGKKFVTHLIPTGIVHGLKSVIGTGCVLNVKKFFKELQDLKDFGVDTDGKIFISKACHIVTEEHILEEQNETKVGTTKQGIGPCYRDKASRTGIRAESIPELKPYLIDMYEEFYLTPGDKVVLCEGSQGFFLDIDLGDYPYVTSSNCGVGAVLNNGFSYKDIRNVFGVAKVYETYVGSKQFQPPGKIFERLQEVGQEFGATTGRKRQCNILNLDNLIKAVRCLGCNYLNLRKLDILDELKFWRFVYNQVEFDFDNSESFQLKIREILFKETKIEHLVFSSNPFGI